MNKRKIFLWVGAGLLLSVTVAAVVVDSVAGRRMDAWSDRVAAAQQRLAVGEERPVLHGEAVPGNAWDRYTVAESMMSDAVEQAVRPTERKKLDSAKIAKLLDDHSEALAQLRQGAHSAEVRVPIESGRPARNLLQLRALSNLAVTKALAQIDEGRHGDAIDSLLDAAQLGRDLMHSPLLINEMIGCAVATIPTCEAVRMNGLLTRLNPASLDRFAKGLEVLDSGIARVGPSMVGESVYFAQMIRGSALPDDKFGWSGRSLRYGLSIRLMLADAGMRMMDLADRAIAATEEPWSTCSARLAQIERELAESDNAVLFSMGSAQRAALTCRYSTIARLRLLRMAIEHQRGRAVPRLADPFGTTLHHAVSATGKPRFWSAGSDGERKIYLF